MRTCEKISEKDFKHEAPENIEHLRRCKVSTHLREKCNITDQSQRKEPTPHNIGTAFKVRIDPICSEVILPHVWA